MAIPDFTSIADAVASTNAKAFGDAGANLALQGAQQFNAHNARLNLLAESVAGGWANRLLTPDPVEAISTVKLMTGRESLGIGEAIALVQQIMKGAQTTPPVTHGL